MTTPKSNGWSDGVALLAEAIDRDMYAMAINSNNKSAQPTPGLSKRAQEQLKSRSFTYYAKARPAEKK